MPVYTYTTLDIPLAQTNYTVATSINDSGQIVGYYNRNSSFHGFLYSNGVFTTLDDPLASPGSTQAFGINNAGQVVGEVNVFYVAVNGFIEANGLYTPIIDPLTPSSTVATGINNSGQIVGYYSLVNGTHGFLFSGGTYTTLDDPLGQLYPLGQDDTAATGINDSGQIVGYYVGGDGNYHGFLYSNGVYTTLDDPLAGSGGTQAFGINNAGQIVGDYLGGSGYHGFLYSNGVYTTLDDPLAGPNGTEAYGINDNGQIVGSYRDSNSIEHGFLLTITPGPATPAAPTDSAVVNGYVNAANDTANQALTGTADNGTTVKVYDNGNFVGSTTADASTGVWSFTIGQLPDASAHSYTVTATDAVGNVSQPSAALNFLVDTTIPAVTAIAETPSTGDLNVGKSVSITLTTSKAVTVTGTPTLTLNDLGTATYSGISADGKTLTFTHTVSSIDSNIASLQVSSINLWGATIQDDGGNFLNLSLSTVPTYSGPQIDIDPFAYEITGPGSDLFGVIDLNTGVFTSLGDMGQTLAGLGSNGDAIYGGAYQGNTLYSVNTSTGALTAIGTSNITYGGFGSTTSGLYALGFNGDLYSINPANGAATDIGPTGFSFSSTVMGMSSGSSTLYLTQNNSLYSLNTTNGSATLIGTTNEGESGFGALVSVGGTLYGGAYGAPTPDVYTLDAQSGAATFVASSPSTPSASGVAGFWGLAPAEAVFQVLDPPPGFGDTYATGVSADGSTVVGDSLSTNYQAFRWTSSTGMISLGSLPGFDGSIAEATNADGSVVVGSLEVAGGGNGPAFRWTAAGIVNIGGDGGGFGVNADGSVVVGYNNGEAFRWTATGTQNLGYLPGAVQSTPFGVSADGSVVVGRSGNGGTTEAFRWTSSEGMIGLGFLSGYIISAANAVSADGAVVVGYNSTGSGVVSPQAFRWTATTGMVGLGYLPGDNESLAEAVNADGSVIVGEGGKGAFRWTAATGMQSIQDILTSDGVALNGFNLFDAHGVSADGTTIVGSMGDNSSKYAEPWRAIIPVEAFALLDLQGVDHSIGSLVWGGTVTNSGVNSPATLTVGSDNTDTTFKGAIQDGTSSTGLTKIGTGTLTLTGSDTYSGGTTIVAGTLDLGSAGEAGNGSITFAGMGATLRSDVGIPANVIKGFTFGDVIDLAGIAYNASGSITLASGNVLQIKENGQTYRLNLNPSQNLAGWEPKLSSDGSTGTNIRLGGQRDDFDFDRTSDILFRNNASGDTWFEAMSNGAANGWNQIGGSSTSYTVVGVGDFYGTGTSDALFRNNSTGDTWLEAISNGAFAGWNQIGGSDTHYSVVGVGDFYGDATDDILFRNNSTGDTWFEAISNGALNGWHQIGGSDTTYAAVGVGDFFGNGTDDILFRNNSTGDTWIEAISNGAPNGWHQIGGSDTHYSVVGVGDFFGNGTDDILFRNKSSGDTWIEQISSGASAGWRQIGGSDTHYAVVAVGDYFGNGTDDILFRNNSTGDTWFESLSNGNASGWHQVGGSNTGYTVKT
jgi:autotransporter-associated beta strand protein/probable HAF family extracellular repeat protein